MIVIAYRYSEDEEDIRTMRRLSVSEARKQPEKALDLMCRGIVEHVSVSIEDFP